MTLLLRTLALAAMAGCNAPLLEGPKAPNTGPTGPQLIRSTAVDLGLESDYQDNWFGQFKRGRMALVEDYDGDGDWDVITGNPGDPSFLIENLTEPGGPLRFQPGQVLSEDALVSSGSAADYDNDGDPDLFIGMGGNDGQAFDRFYRNDRTDPSSPSDYLVDISAQLEIAPVLADAPLANGSFGVLAFDADNDSWLDVYVSNDVRWPDHVAALEPEDVEGLNQLYHSTGGAQTAFENRAWEIGLTAQSSTRNSTLLDFDRDGDVDLFENNWIGDSVLWRNRFVEDGALGFEDVSSEMSLNSDLNAPVYTQAMCTISTDLNNDGWQDLAVFVRDKFVLDIPDELWVEHHLLWINLAGEGFAEVGAWSNLNDKAFARDHMSGDGVMGCQIHDLDLDGFPDLFFGNGGGDAGAVNNLMVSSHLTQVDLPGIGPVDVPQYEDWSSLIDSPPPHHLQRHGLPADYPLRSHGTVFADFDRDGVDELAIHNGGPAEVDEMEEPNRLFKFTLVDPRFLRVRLRGNGTTTNRDAIGTRVRVRVARDHDGAAWDVWETRWASTGFDAQNAPELVFGLADGDRVTEIEVHWHNGGVEWVEPPEGNQNWMTIEQP